MTVAAQYPALEDLPQDPDNANPVKRHPAYVCVLVVHVVKLKHEYVVLPTMEARVRQQELQKQRPIPLPQPVPPPVLRAALLSVSEPLLAHAHGLLLPGLPSSWRRRSCQREVLRQ